MPSRLFPAPDQPGAQHCPANPSQQRPTHCTDYGAVALHPGTSGGNRPGRCRVGQPCLQQRHRITGQGMIGKRAFGIGQPQAVVQHVGVGHQANGAPSDATQRRHPLFRDTAIARTSKSGRPGNGKQRAAGQEAALDRPALRRQQCQPPMRQQGVEQARHRRPAAIPRRQIHGPDQQRIGKDHGFSAMTYPAIHFDQIGWVE